MRPRTVPCLAAIAVIVVAASVGGCRSDARPRSATQRSADAQPLEASICHAMWANGFELEGVVGGRATQAYFDSASLTGTDDRVSGIVVPSDAQRRGPLADAVIGLTGHTGDRDCDVQLQGEEGIDDSVWRLRIDSAAAVTGTHRSTDGRTEPVVFRVVPETPCDGAGEWRTFSAPDWPITFEYPASWKLTADQDDVNIECPSVTRLAVGGSFLTFERGRFPPSDTKPGAEIAAEFNEPYWFFRRPGDVWRVKDGRCDPEAPRVQRSGLGARASGLEAPGADDCSPARRSERNGTTILQGAAGEHRRYRPGVGYLGQGAGIARYLWIFGDRWVSLDSTEWTHYDDIRSEGGPVLIDGNDVGDRVVRSVRPR